MTVGNRGLVRLHTSFNVIPDFSPGSSRIAEIRPVIKKGVNTLYFPMKLHERINAIAAGL